MVVFGLDYAEGLIVLEFKVVPLEELVFELVEGFLVEGGVPGGLSALVLGLQLVMAGVLLEGLDFLEALLLLLPADLFIGEQLLAEDGQPRLQSLLGDVELGALALELVYFGSQLLHGSFLLGVVVLVDFFLAA